MDHLRELIPFLRDKNPQARALALEGLVPQTLLGSPHRSIFFTGLGGGGLQKAKENDIIRDLKILCRDQLSVAHDAFRALVNLSDSPLLVTSLSEPSFLNFLVSYILNPHSILADLASMLLSNLTASSPTCSVLLNLKIKVIPDKRLISDVYPVDSRSNSCPAPVPFPSEPEQQVPALPLLLAAFVQGATVGDISDLANRKRKGELHFLATVFANITLSHVGRKYFISPQPVNVLNHQDKLEYPLSKIVAFTEHKDKIRRGGVASTIKNCAFLAVGHKAILSPDTELVTVPPSTIAAPGIDALPHILLPLAGPEEFDLEDQEKLPLSLQFLPPTKKREVDSSIRLTYVETLILFCHTRWGRDYLRENGVYEIVRSAHVVEGVDSISEHIERLVQLLKGSEPEGNQNQLIESEDITLLDIDIDHQDVINGAKMSNYFNPVGPGGFGFGSLLEQQGQVKNQEQGQGQGKGESKIEEVKNVDVDVDDEDEDEDEDSMIQEII